MESRPGLAGLRGGAPSWHRTQRRRRHGDGQGRTTGGGRYFKHRPPPRSVPPVGWSTCGPDHVRLRRPATQLGTHRRRQSSGRLAARGATLEAGRPAAAVVLSLSGECPPVDDVEVSPLHSSREAIRPRSRCRHRGESVAKTKGVRTCSGGERTWGTRRHGTRRHGQRREQPDGLCDGVVEVAHTALQRVQCTQHASSRAVFAWLAAAYTPRGSRARANPPRRGRWRAGAS